MRIFFVLFQEIVLKLEARSRIDQIQFLGHNFMIPKEVEIWLGDLPMASDDPELSKAMFYCLGVVSRSIIFMLYYLKYLATLIIQNIPKDSNHCFDSLAFF